MKKIFLIFFLALAAHFPSLNNDFTFDDNVHVVHNELIQNLTFENIKEVFSSAIFPGDLYRPVIIFSYQLTYFFVDMDPFLYHLINIFFHILVSILVLITLNKVNKNLAFLVSILFAVHPIHTETIANISGRAEIFAAFFGLLALNLSFFNFKNLLSKTIFITSIFLLALLSKESSFVIVPLLILMKFLKLDSLKEILLSVSPYILAGFIYFILRSNALGQFLATPYTNFVNNPISSLSDFNSLTISLSLLGKYIFQLFYPIGLQIDYSYNVINLENSQIYLYLFPLLGIIFFLIYSLFKNKKEYIFSISWFLIAFVITSNLLVPIGTIFAERLAYLPSIGILSLISIFILNLNNLTIKNIFLIILIPLLISITQMRSKIWKNDKVLFNEIVKIAPNNTKAHYNLGILLKNQNNKEAAKFEFNESIRIYPDNTEALQGLAALEIDQANFQKAKNYLTRALKVDPNNIITLNLLGHLEIAEKNFFKAYTFFKKAEKLDPDNFNTILGYFIIAVEKKELEQVESLKKVLEKIKPNSREVKFYEDKLKSKK